MNLESNDIHIWTVDLSISPEQELIKQALLSREENERALRFRQPIHKQRFIAARAALRQILGVYLNTSPEKITFGYSEHKKPFLQMPMPAAIEFNLAHSHDIAVIAVTLDHPVGVDIEKIQNVYNQAVVERYYNPQESQELLQLPDEDRISGFYRLWSRKEAVVKAVGTGLAMSLPTFSVSVRDIAETIALNDQHWLLHPLYIHPDYQAALASCQPIKKISYWKFFEHGSVLDKVSVI